MEKSNGNKMDTVSMVSKLQGIKCGVSSAIIFSGRSG